MEKQIDNKQDEIKEVKIDSNLDTKEGQLDNQPDNGSKVQTYVTVDLGKINNSSENNYIPLPGTEEDMNRIKGLIRENVSFAGVVYGYRGTGKTSFVDNVLKEFTNSRVIIRFNATNYDEYPKFLKRFIRELYLAVTNVIKSNPHQKDNLNYKNLKNIYKHTFYNITESSSEEHIISEQLTKNISLSLESTIEKTVDIVSIFAAVMSQVVIFLFKNSNKINADTLKQSIIAFASVFALNVASKLVLNVGLEKNSTNGHENKSTKSEESLYDDEIAEYHVFNEIEKISNEYGLGKIIFVLDELDKLDEDRIKKIIKELKPLILSPNVISILVAGKNYEKYLDEEQDETDSIADNIFSQKIYIPLVNGERAKEIMKSLFVTKEGTSFDNSEYLDEKVVRAEGVIRNMINLILSDITWVEKEDEVKETNPKETDTEKTDTEKTDTEKADTEEMNSEDTNTEEIDTKDNNDIESNDKSSCSKEARVKYCREDGSHMISSVMRQSYQKISALDAYISENYSDKLSAKTDEMYKLAFRICRYVREKNLDFDDDVKTKVKEGLENYISDNISHLDDKEKNLVFSKIFDKERVDEDKKEDGSSRSEEIAFEGALKNAIEEREDIINRIFKKTYGIDLSNEQRDMINWMISDVNLLFQLFSNNNIAERETLKVAYEELELFRNDHSSYDEFKQRTEQISEEFFVYNLVSRMGIVENVKGNISRIDEENVSVVAAKVAYALLRIVYWKNSERKSSYKKFYSWKKDIILNRWDIVDLLDGHLNVVEVKYYKRNYTNEGTLKSVFNEAKKLLSLNNVKTVNVVLAIFVPDSDRIVDSFGINKGIARGLVNNEPDNIRDRISFSVCYLSYNRQRDFNEGLEEFLSLTERH
ncbi:ATP-binding protein [Butyrivibrio fibrisolvens]|uniref:KAP NTPase domain-containing protein n=1 Tax=Butyrivibrio fibrisolvens TaxID=831 RepID=A0A317G405_BUTFI|nr:ATP-binding protein [Butyrivibrio fibrisolvens]PWT28775.1 hypothetical protein CPT75_17495 [Butyrivibrio fibrisolvens]